MNQKQQIISNMPSNKQLHLLERLGISLLLFLGLIFGSLASLSVTEGTDSYLKLTSMPSDP